VSATGNSGDFRRDREIFFMTESVLPVNAQPQKSAFAFTFMPGFSIHSKEGDQLD